MSRAKLTLHNNNILLAKKNLQSITAYVTTITSYLKEKTGEESSYLKKKYISRKGLVKVKA